MSASSEYVTLRHGWDSYSKSKLDTFLLWKQKSEATMPQIGYQLNKSWAAYMKMMIRLYQTFYGYQNGSRNVAYKSISTAIKS